MLRSCCVTGHRGIPDNKRNYVKQELERAIQQALMEGYRMFLTGFAQGVDLLFAQCVIAQREKYPDLFLEAALPFAGRVKQLRTKEKELLAQCDGIQVIREEYQSDCFFQRNKYLVDNSDRVIAVYDGRGLGGTFYTISYARKMNRDLRIIDL